MKEISTTKTIPSPKRGVCLIHSLLVQKTDLFISCFFPHDHFFTGNSVFWPELCIPASGLVPPRLDPRVPMPEDTGAAGMDGCSSCAGGEKPLLALGASPPGGEVLPLGDSPCKTGAAGDAGCEEEAWVLQWARSQDPGALRGTASPITLCLGTTELHQPIPLGLHIGSRAHLLPPESSSPHQRFCCSCQLVLHLPTVK